MQAFKGPGVIHSDSPMLVTHQASAAGSDRELSNIDTQILWRSLVQDIVTVRRQSSRALGSLTAGAFTTAAFTTANKQTNSRLIMCG